MPAIPLYETPLHPHAWHRVAAPGGYEAWSFIAEDRDGVRIEISLFDGDSFNDGYQTAYKRYRRRPTRVAPPVPRDFPAIRIEVFQQNVSRWQQKLPLPAGSFAAASAPVQIKAGPCAAILEANENWRVTAEPLSAELFFESPEPFDCQAAQMYSTESTIAHFRVSDLREYRVRGSYRLPKGAPTEFDGKGHLVHLFGTGPVHY